MVVKKFFGASTRDALRQVRDELGPDALILSNRQVAGGGIEIMAVADADVAALTSVQTVSAPPKPATRAAQNGARLMQSAQAEAPMAKALARSYAIADEDNEPTLADLPPAEAPSVLRSNRSQPVIRPAEFPAYDSPAPAPRPRPVVRPAEPARTEEIHPPRFTFEEPENKSPQAHTPSVSPEAVNDIAREVRLLRGLLESQLAGMAWGELAKHAPEKLEVLRQLLGSGFCPALSRQLIDKLPAGQTIEQSLKWVKAALAHNLMSVGAHDDLVQRGGIYALIGPTGVGKTTTVAKLAARCALTHGPQSVALLTTDSYRIGAHDQLRIYGRILSVPVHEIKDETDLHLTLGELSDRHLVLIDTVGMGQRDQRISEQLALFNQDNVGTLLLLSANAQSATLDDVARRYRNRQLVGCILTKLDETMNLGGCLDVAIRHKLPLHFVTNGQRVPEDLHRPNTDYLIDRAFRTQQDSSIFQLQNDEYPLYMGTQETPTDFALKWGAGHG
ncbi:flagellar biosynthesis protein FlhF [Chitinilyticum piscinae]|uniref:Flagellar biosynthesis protein FlhF n=1 Tax=Chitinilyticum piscinae TaxID=2866724 RepID=A0A8J7KF87_9NEIS|nr:flagellar biosynthesis protein FlhF [Chitinilyticum piscinae]MBE9609954.1 flagellar biosynthesis protein FlhF [Chitinilyticum piscinae]